MNNVTIHSQYEVTGHMKNLLEGIAWAELETTDEAFQQQKGFAEALEELGFRVVSRSVDFAHQHVDLYLSKVGDR